MSELLQAAPVVVLGAITIGVLVLFSTLVVCLALRDKVTGAVWPFYVAIGAIAAPGFALAWAARRAAGEMADALRSSDPSAAATTMAAAISGALHASAPFVVGETALIAMGTSVVLMSVVRGRTPLVPLAVVAAAAALEVLLYGALGYVHDLVESFQAVAVADPSEKSALLGAALDEARERLHTWVHGALALGAVSGLLGVLAASRKSAAPPAPLPIAVPASLAALGVLGVLASVPALGEAHAPVVSSSRLAAVPDDIQAPALTGPDHLQHAPSIALRPDGSLTLEGFAIERIALLGAKLEELRQVEAVMRPDAPRGTRLTAAIDGRTTGAVLRALLVALSAEGYPDVQLVFVETVTTERPLLGRVTSTRITGVTASLHEGAQGPRVAFSDERTYAELAAELVRRRADGQQIALALEKP